MDRSRYAVPLVALLLVGTIAGAYTLVLTALGSSPPRSGATPTDAATLPSRAAIIPTNPGNRTLYFVPIDSFPPETAAELAAWYGARYGLEVSVRDALPLHESTRDPGRNQLVAERLIELLRRGQPDLESDGGAVVIGLVSEDLYILDRTDWAWAFGLRSGGRYAVVSEARMADGDRAVVVSRLRKMLTKNIALLYWGLEASDEPSSPVYRDVVSVRDLDRMGEDFG